MTAKSHKYRKVTAALSKRKPSGAHMTARTAARRPIKLLAAVLATLSVAGTVIAAPRYEEPRHSVVDQAGNIQIRQYEPALMAEVEVTGDRGAAVNSGFRILAAYIFGSNSARESISMTAPVTQTPQREPRAEKNEVIAMTAPVTQTPVASGEQGSAAKVWRVQFMMPSKYTPDSLPAPKDARIRFLTEPGQKRAVIRFSGRSSDDNVNSHRQELERFVQERGLKTSGAYTYAMYDDPFTLPWNRRNEWWVTLSN
jgi:hypothetical protein